MQKKIPPSQAGFSPLPHTDTGATGIKDIGKVMGMASKLVAGKADNKMISEIIKKLLP